MHLLAHDDKHLILRQKSYVWIIATGIFTAISAFGSFNLLLGGVTRLTRLNIFQIFGWLFWMVFAVGLVGVGVIAFFSTWHGKTIIFDKDDETFTVRQANLIRLADEAHSIYGIKRLDIRQNDEINVLGIFMILRNNQEIPITTYPHYARQQADDLANLIRAFLW